MIHQEIRLDGADVTLTIENGDITSVTEGGNIKEMDTVKIVIQIDSETTAELERDESGKFVLSILDS